jgi:hypothetical protein
VVCIGNGSSSKKVKNNWGVKQGLPVLGLWVRAKVLRRVFGFKKEEVSDAENLYKTNYIICNLYTMLLK